MHVILLLFLLFIYFFLGGGVGWGTSSRLTAGGVTTYNMFLNNTGTKYQAKNNCYMTGENRVS